MLVSNFKKVCLNMLFKDMNTSGEISFGDLNCLHLEDSSKFLEHSLDLCFQLEWKSCEVLQFGDLKR